MKRNILKVLCLFVIINKVAAELDKKNFLLQIEKSTSTRLSEKVLRKRAADGGCLLPTASPHSSFTISSGVGPSVQQFTRLDFQCHPGFSLIGSNRTYCIEGNWLPSAPTCSKTCKPLKSTFLEYDCRQNGVKIPCSSPMLAGTKADVSCSENFTPTGLRSDTITCKKNGEWQNTYVTCIAECGTIPEDSKISPWHASLHEKLDEADKKICSATLVNANTVLTAAHCFCTATTIKNADLFGVKITASDALVGNKEMYKVKRFVVHPDYFGPDSNHQQDIALVILSNVIEFTPNIKPICIDWTHTDLDKKMSSGSILQVSGFPLSKTVDVKSEMKMLNVRIMKRETCRKIAPTKIRNYITRDKFCAQYVKEEDGAVGESGEGSGIFKCKRDHGSSVNYIKGVVTNCEINNQTLVSTSITPYLDFLKNNEVHRNIESFSCKSGEQINEDDICDGVFDCKDESDEADELCNVMDTIVPIAAEKLPTSTCVDVVKPESTTKLMNILPTEEYSTASVSPVDDLVTTTTSTTPTTSVLPSTTIESSTNVAENAQPDAEDNQPQVDYVDYVDNRFSSNEIGCILPDFPANGNYTIYSNEIPVPGEVVPDRKNIDFTCNHPYVIRGLKSLICMDNSWNIKPPICVNSIRTPEEKVIPEDCSMVQSNVSGVYKIWPYLTEKPFNVFCDFDFLNAKWTVIQNRFDGSVNFNRSYTEFEEGFGDLEGEHWIGLSHMSDITDGKNYELYILMTDFENQTRFARFDHFKVDVWNGFSTGEYIGTAGNALDGGSFTFCTYDKRKLVGDPFGYPYCTKDYETGWWRYSGDKFSNLNGPYINESFSGNTSGLTWSEWRINYSLKSTKMMVRKLMDNFDISGSSKLVYPEDCSQVESNVSGVHIIHPPGAPNAFSVYCDISASSKWTVIQKKFSGISFDRKYQEYQFGFGDLNGAHWIGLERIYQLTKNNNYVLDIELMDSENVTKRARYAEFSISSANDGYRLKVAQYRGTAGDSLTNHNGYQFSTSDHDVDDYEYSCARDYTGAWWYHNCFNSDLNGFNMIWGDWHGFDYPLQATKMSIRKKNT